MARRLGNGILSPKRATPTLRLDVRRAGATDGSGLFAAAHRGCELVADRTSSDGLRELRRRLKCMRPLACLAGWAHGRTEPALRLPALRTGAIGRSDDGRLDGGCEGCASDPSGIAAKRDRIAAGVAASAQRPFARGRVARAAASSVRPRSRAAVGRGFHALAR